MSNQTIYPGLEQCSVLIDSKKDEKSCGDFDSVGTEVLTLPFHVNAYILDDKHLVPNLEAIFGFEVALPYDQNWTEAKFRIIRSQGCGRDCRPRCVTINRPGSPSAKEAREYLIYDCDVGIYHDTANGVAQATSGSTYSLDLCLDKACQSFFLRLPEEPQDSAGLILVESNPLRDEQHLILHFPPGFEPGVNVTLKIESKDSHFEMEGYLNKAMKLEHYIGFQLDPDTAYSISYMTQDSTWVKIAQFNTGARDTSAMGAILSIFIIVILLTVGIVIWKRYKHVQEKHKVNPNRLLESGRIKAKNVLIITNVDCRLHINICFALIKYLKTHCAVGEVYYFLDPNNGYKSHETHDPWKWSQEISEKINEENGFLLYIGGPPTEMSISVYKNLPNNQAFVGTAYLKSMADDNRVAVINFPYSDHETIPDVVPQHLKNDYYLFPRDANAFLCQLLDVKRRALFPCLSYPLVRPKILPHELQHYKGGKELLSEIEALTSKVMSFRAQQKLESENQKSEVLQPTTGTTSEIKGLLSSPQMKNGSVKLDATSATNATNPNEEGLQVALEQGILSVNDPKFEERDKTLNEDLE